MSIATSRNRTASRRAGPLLLVLAIFFVLIAVLSSTRITLTLDESLHYHYGLFVLQGNSDRIDDSSMPVSAINALPLYMASRLPDGVLKTALERLFLARLVTILFAAWLASIVFRWTHALYGLAPAICATLLYALDPNIIANSQLVTTDIFAAGTMILSLYLTWRFAHTRRWRDGLIGAFVIGVSQLVKYTAIALFPLCLIVLLVHDWPLIHGAVSERSPRSIVRYAGRVGAIVVAWVATAIVLINLGFLFNRSFTPLRDYRFRSDTFKALQAELSNLGAVPIPVPYPYLEGLDWIRDTEQRAGRYGNVYLLGHLSKPRGFPGYYFVASALKVPIATQILFLGALAMFMLDRQRRAKFLSKEVFLLLPATVLVLYFNFFFNVQTGIRYYLVFFPLLYVFTGSLFGRWSALSVPARAVRLALLGYLAFSVLSYFPYFTPYFNEFVWDKTQSYKFLADSNLEWGQSQGDLREYLVEHPDAIPNPAGPQAGHLVVGGSDLVGILEDPDRYAWLRKNFEPVDTIAYCYFVYRVSAEELAAMCSGTETCD
jgi:4-amino-4-deoxy-L-arabinose transferase-like glycosyltransferase